MRSLFLFFNCICIAFCCSSQAYTPCANIKKIPALEAHVKEIYDASKSSIPKKELSKDQEVYLKKNYGERYKTTLALIRDSAIIDNCSLSDELRKIFNIVLDKNPDIGNYKQIYIVRDPTANAFTFGDEIIFVNLGLIYRVKSYEELMLVVCHEIAHNELDHYESTIYNYARTMLSDSIERSIRNIYREEIGQVSALNELFLPWILSSKEQSRDFENAADSMAIRYFRNTGYDLSKAAGLYPLLQHIEHERDTLPLDLKTELMLPPDMDFTKQLSYEQSNSLGVFTKKTDSLEILLRTHPFPAEREARFRHEFTAPPSAINFSEEEFTAFKYNVECEMIRCAIQQKNMGKTLFYWIQLQKSFPSDDYYNHMLTYIFAVLSYEKTSRREGLVIERSDIHFDENYDRLLYFLRRLNPKECLALSKYYFDKINKSSSSFLSDYARAITAGIEKDKQAFESAYTRIKDEPHVFGYIMKEIYSKLNR